MGSRQIRIEGVYRQSRYKTVFFRYAVQEGWAIEPPPPERRRGTLSWVPHTSFLRVGFFCLLFTANMNGPATNLPGINPA